SRTNGRATIAVAAPIRWRGRITGVAAVGLDLEQLRRVVHEVDPARSDRLVVVDAHGRVIAHSSPEWEAVRTICPASRSFEQRKSRARARRTTTPSTPRPCG